MPSAELSEVMGNYNQELVDAGIMRGEEVIKPSSEAKRVAFDGEGREALTAHGPLWRW